MSVDEERKFPMTSFSRVKGVSVAKDSDHCPLFVELNITFDIKRQPRKEIFNLRNKECQTKFYEVTANSVDLRQCFENDNSLDSQASAWFRKLTSKFHTSFKKIRITKQNQMANYQVCLLKEAASEKS